MKKYNYQFVEGEEVNFFIGAFYDGVLLLGMVLKTQKYLIFILFFLSKILYFKLRCSTKRYQRVVISEMERR